MVAVDTAFSPLDPQEIIFPLTNHFKVALGSFFCAFNVQGDFSSFPYLHGPHKKENHKVHSCIIKQTYKSSKPAIKAIIKGNACHVWWPLPMHWIMYQRLLLLQAGFDSKHWSSVCCCPFIMEAIDAGSPLGPLKLPFLSWFLWGPSTGSQPYTLLDHIKLVFGGKIFKVQPGFVNTL